MSTLYSATLLEAGKWRWTAYFMRIPRGERKTSPIHAGMSHCGPINVDVVLIVELEELLLGELCAIVHDNGVRDSKAMDDVEEE